MHRYIKRAIVGACVVLAALVIYGKSIECQGLASGVFVSCARVD